MVKTYFINKLNNHKVNDGGAFAVLWCFVFGPLYFAIRGNWSWFFIALILIPTTLFLSVVVVPFLAPRINRSNLLNRGFQEIK